jgi:hypothetical protein
MKRCWVCKQELDINMFGNNKSKRDGLSDECRCCKSIKDAQYRLKNKEKKRIRDLEYKRINKDKLKVQNKNYYETNKDAIS